MADSGDEHQVQTTNVVQLPEGDERTNYSKTEKQKHIDNMKRQMGSAHRSVPIPPVGVTMHDLELSMVFADKSRRMWMQVGDELRLVFDPMWAHP